jgi:hypothetical protein
MTAARELMMLMMLLAAAALASPAAAGSRQVELGVENFYYRTAETALNRGNFLGLEPGEDLLRGTLGWKESRGALRGVFRGLVERRLGEDGDTEGRIRQAYLQYDWGDGLSLRLGKQRVAWGSGFAWNPTSRLEPPKNPLNTSLEQEGAWAARGDWVPASWASVTLVAARTEADTADAPYETPDRERRTAAVRARFLVRNTDLALVYSGGKGQRTLLGLDVGRSFGSVSAHAEAALYHGAELPPPREGERFGRLAAGALWVGGEWSAALEYFWNGEGYDDAQRAAYLSALESAQGPAYLALAAVPSAGGLGLGRQYLHASGTWADDSGRWTASLRGLAALSDGGFALTPGLVYAPRGDLTLHLDAVVLWGPSDSEYRLAPLRGAVQSRVRFLF